jgi:head-tail adaptor
MKGGLTPSGQKNWTIRLARRANDQPLPFSAEVRVGYTTFLTTRAKVETKSGTAEFNRVVIGDRQVTHTFTIRYTKIVIDTRDRVIDALGNVYAILAIEVPEMRLRDMKLHCASLGSEDNESVT